jgi:membrane fusion protein (multidrug efflux system)
LIPVLLKLRDPPFIGGESLYFPNGRLSLSLRRSSDIFDPLIDLKTGTFPLQAYFPNPNNLLKAEQFVRVRLQWGEIPDALCVPRRSVFEGAKGQFVFVKTPDNKADMRIVEGKAWGDNFFLVTKGLSAGEEIVVDGVMKLQKGSPLKVTSFVKNQVPSPFKEKT